jgi:hypothetical protein
MDSDTAGPHRKEIQNHRTKHKFGNLSGPHKKVKIMEEETGKEGRARATQAPSEGGDSNTSAIWRRKP